MKENAEELYFSFNLGEGMFSVPVAHVKEVFDFASLTPVPNSLPYLKGVMNIRGSVVSIVDLRKLFGFEPMEDLTGTSVIDLEIPVPGEKPFEFSILADKVDIVSSLAMVPAESVSYGIPEAQRYFVRSVARRGDTFILVLDLPKIIEFIESDVNKSGAAGF
ncbi:MAG: purine-binding chemotaxis protein CheW [Treponema sp.]|nr:purine-binding chemotaxis protein CheW [Candidatus Treponema equifaecale]